MKITLDANPSDAPCCLKIIAENGKDLLVQTDWDWPGVARTFGWSLSVIGDGCPHSFTDGTVDCSECGLTAGDFIQAARQWLDDNDGAQADDPGYFDGGAQ